MIFRVSDFQFFVEIHITISIKFQYARSIAIAQGIQRIHIFEAGGNNNVNKR